LWGGGKDEIGEDRRKNFFWEIETGGGGNTDGGKVNVRGSKGLNARCCDGKILLMVRGGEIQKWLEGRNWQVENEGS